MGRSPFFFEQVRFVDFADEPAMSFLQNFCREEFHHRNEVYLRIDRVDPILSDDFRMERSCSTYGHSEIYLPSPGEVYRIASIDRYVFPGFTYDMLTLEAADHENRMPSFMLRSDGMILNRESFEARGRVADAALIL